MGTVITAHVDITKAEWGRIGKEPRKFGLVADNILLAKVTRLKSGRWRYLIQCTRLPFGGTEPTKEHAVETVNQKLGL